VNILYIYASVCCVESDACVRLTRILNKNCVVISLGFPAQSGDINDQFHIDKFHAVTEVEFDELSPEVINAYIETGEPM